MQDIRRHEAPEDLIPAIGPDARNDPYRPGPLVSHMLTFEKHSDGLAALPCESLELLNAAIPPRSFPQKNRPHCDVQPCPPQAPKAHNASVRIAPPELRKVVGRVSSPEPCGVVLNQDSGLTTSD
jgi:hypothetical protein